MNQNSEQKIGVDLHTLDLLLDSFSTAVANPETDRNELYSAINHKVVACTESQASAILVQNKEGQIRVAQQTGWKELSPAVTSEIKDFVEELFRKQNVTGFNKLTHSTIYAGKCSPQNGLTFLFVLVRSQTDSELAGQVFGDLVAEIANQIEAYENQRAADHKPTSVLELTHLAQLVQNLGKSSSLDEMSFHLVNDFSKITKADRATYVSNAGRITAVSGVTKVSFRTSVARILTKIARLTVNSGGVIEWNDDQLTFDGKRTPRGLQALIQELPSIAGFSIPLEHEGRFGGVLLLEYFSEENIGLERRELVNEAVGFAGPVIGRAVQVNSIPAIGLLDYVFNRVLVRPTRTAIWAAAFLGVLVGLAYLLFSVKRPFEIYGEGILQTVEKRHVFAQIEGEVDRLLVEEGQMLEQSQQLMVIASEDLEKELITIEGEIEEAKQELNNLLLSDFENETSDQMNSDDTKTASDIERVKIRLRTLNAKLAFFEGKKSDLVVNAPIDGQVTTTNLHQRLIGRPINRGDLLMTISDTDGPWELELEIPDNRVEFIKQAQREQEAQPLEVVFRLASDSRKTFVGHLQRLDYRSDQRDENKESIVLAYVEIDEPELAESLRLGTRVYGKINCGDRNNFFLLTYEARNKIREWLFQ